MSKGYLLRKDEDWTWEDLRNYIVDQQEHYWGRFPRNWQHETGITKGFMKRYGADAPRIARYAYEISKGVWMKAPCKITRFQKASDSVFGDEILRRLGGAKNGHISE